VNEHGLGRVALGRASRPLTAPATAADNRRDRRDRLMDEPLKGVEGPRKVATVEVTQRKVP
jgi:hypothetical protein